MEALTHDRAPEHEPFNLRLLTLQHPSPSITLSGNNPPITSFSTYEFIHTCDHFLRTWMLHFFPTTPVQQDRRTLYPLFGTCQAFTFYPITPVKIELTLIPLNLPHYRINALSLYPFSEHYVLYAFSLQIWGGATRKAWLDSEWVIQLMRKWRFSYIMKVVYL